MNCGHYSEIFGRTVTALSTGVLDKKHSIYFPGSLSLISLAKLLLTITYRLAVSKQDQL